MNLDASTSLTVTPPMAVELEFEDLSWEGGLWGASRRRRRCEN